MASSPAPGKITLLKTQTERDNVYVHLKLHFFYLKLPFSFQINKQISEVGRNKTERLMPRAPHEISIKVHALIREDVFSYDKGEGFVVNKNSWQIEKNMLKRLKHVCIKMRKPQTSKTLVPPVFCHLHHKQTL